MPCKELAGLAEVELSDIFSETVATVQELLQGGQHAIVLDLLAPRLAFLEDRASLNVTDLKNGEVSLRVPQVRRMELVVPEHRTHASQGSQSW